MDSLKITFLAIRNNVAQKKNRYENYRLKCQFENSQDIGFDLAMELKMLVNSCASRY